MSNLSDYRRELSQCWLCNPVVHRRSLDPDPGDLCLRHLSETLNRIPRRRHAPWASAIPSETPRQVTREDIERAFDACEDDQIDAIAYGYRMLGNSANETAIAFNRFLETLVDAMPEEQQRQALIDANVDRRIYWAPTVDERLPPGTVSVRVNGNSLGGGWTFPEPPVRNPIDDIQQAVRMMEGYTQVPGDEPSGDAMRLNLEATQTCWKKVGKIETCGEPSDERSDTGVCTAHYEEYRDR